jgi:hypothetical protein
MGLADEIRDKIDSGDLPRSKPRKVWGGFGDFGTCSGCGQSIFPAQIRYEFSVDLRAFRFHFGCFGLWDAETRRHSFDRPATLHEVKLRLVREFLQRELRHCHHDDYVDAAAGAHVFVIETHRGLQHSLIIPQCTFEHPDFASLCNTTLIDALAHALQHARAVTLTLTPEGVE